MLAAGEGGQDQGTLPPVVFDGGSAPRSKSDWIPSFHWVLGLHTTGAPPGPRGCGPSVSVDTPWTPRCGGSVPPCLQWVWGVWGTPNPMKTASMGGDGVQKPNERRVLNLTSMGGGHPPIERRGIRCPDPRHHSYRLDQKKQISVPAY